MDRASLREEGFGFGMVLVGVFTGGVAPIDLMPSCVEAEKIKGRQAPRLHLRECQRKGRKGLENREGDGEEDVCLVSYGYGCVNTVWELVSVAVSFYGVFRSISSYATSGVGHQVTLVIKPTRRWFEATAHRTDLSEPSTGIRM